MPARGPGPRLPLRGVLDLAHQLLQHVFEEDDSPHDPFGVDHPGHMRSGALHGGQDVLHLVGSSDGREPPDPLGRDGFAALRLFGPIDLNP